jgi:hypothetical protein
MDRNYSTSRMPIKVYEDNKEGRCIRTSWTDSQLLPNGTLALWTLLLGINFKGRIVKQYMILLSIVIIFGCSIRPTKCIIIEESSVGCVPVQSYVEWNKCIIPCEGVQINSKTKPHKPQKWERPRPYAYP